MAVLRFPRLYAAASLKPMRRRRHRDPCHPFSAALCRGLIEALAVAVECDLGRRVFRGFMPRPH